MKLPGYHAKGDQTLTTTNTTALTIVSNATTVQRNIIDEYILSIQLTPSDSQISWTSQRCTAAGTSTAVTPLGQDDEADRAAQAAVGKNHTVEPTYTANAFIFEAMNLNARATYRWVAAPGAAIITPAVVGDGIGFMALHASRTEDFGVQSHWTE
jgi:hypothetical protein